ncbi:MAG: nucleotide sugar dehydrogenase [Rhodospirillales bacterium]|nr:nucleotide sugar dehydrogenase [Rhodospirillales bacterium]
MSHGRRLSVIGLGYVGLPVAASFARAGDSVISYDIDSSRIKELTNGHDRTNEIQPGEMADLELNLTDEAADLAQADFHIVCVPTPIDASNNPDLKPLLSASGTVGQILKKGDIVVYESTVYPGATEEECVPVLEDVSGLCCGVDFTVGYSPERINPGDREHRFETIIKVVSGSDEATLDVVARVYGSVVTAGVHRAPNIRTAEAAKVIENTQRDLNIALMNELATICHKLDIDTHAVLEAARTKWNFLPFVPGLVGGHCIGVDPYYLTHRAQRAGYHPEVILAGRRINDGMGKYVASETVKQLMRAGYKGEHPVITILGATFKEDVPDVRNSKIADVCNELVSLGAEVQVVDPVADQNAAKSQLGLELTRREAALPSDAVILGVAHSEFIQGSWPLIVGLLRNGMGVVCDLKNCLPVTETPEGIVLWRL